MSSTVPARATAFAMTFVVCLAAGIPVHAVGGAPRTARPVGSVACINRDCRAQDPVRRPVAAPARAITPVRSPLTPGTSGDGVRALQDALTELASRNLIRPFTPPESLTPLQLSAVMTTMNIERTASTFGVATQRLVGLIQLQQGLGVHRRGHVDAATARVINQLLGITER
jgi:hypothetical protein